MYQVEQKEGQWEWRQEPGTVDDAKVQLQRGGQRKHRSAILKAFLDVSPFIFSFMMVNNKRETRELMLVSLIAQSLTLTASLIQSFG